MLDVSKQENFETSPVESNVDIKEDALPEATTVVVAAVPSEVPVPQIQQPSERIPTQKIKKVSSFLLVTVTKDLILNIIFLGHCA